MLGMGELLIILVIVLVLFGAGRITNVMGEAGKGVRAFKEGLRGEAEGNAKIEAAKDKTPE